jgi:hypothetical protein
MERWRFGMDLRKLVYWILQVFGAFVCIAAFVNIGGALLHVSMFGSSIETSYYLMFTALFALGLLLIYGGSFFKPRVSAQVR